MKLYVNLIEQGRPSIKLPINISRPTKYENCI